MIFKVNLSGIKFLKSLELISDDGIICLLRLDIFFVC